MPENPLVLLRRIFRGCQTVVKYGAGHQEPTRAKVVKRLRRICTNCEKAYEDFLKHIGTIEKHYSDPKRLLKAVRAVSKDPKYRRTFKPDRLCGDVDGLLADIQSWLNPLRWSVGIRRVSKLRNQLKRFQNYDQAFYMVFDNYALELSDLSVRLDRAIEENRPVRRIISSIERRTRKVKGDISKTLRTVEAVLSDVSI